VTPGKAALLGGRYRVGDLLGRGGMSEVYHGYDERLDRPVAIKMLRQPTGDIPDDGSPEAMELQEARRRDRARFLREIRTAARLEHPGTPAVYDTGVDEQPDGSDRIWLVMQVLRGSTLDTAMTTEYANELPEIAWAAAVGAQIAAVLADLHRVDIVHRDIKPANVMIVDGGLVKVLDFGIAILRGAGALPRLTQVDKTVGTPAYMSPEQHLGRPVTAASDVYSLGCLLYELLSGDQPFLATPSMPIRAHHLESPVPSLSTTRAGIADALALLVARMMGKDPVLRPTAEQVYTELTPYVRSAGSAADRDPTRPFLTPLLSPARREAAAPAGSPLTDAEYAGLRAEAARLVGEGADAEAVRLLEDGLRRSVTSPFLALELRHVLGTTLFYVGEHRRAATLLDDVGAEYRRRGLANSHRTVLECAYCAGHAYAEVGEQMKALAHLRFYVQNVCADVSEDTEQVLESRFVIAQMLALDDRAEEALAELETVRPAFAAMYGDESTHVRNIEKQIDRLRRLED
jgi:hypothetical protein